MTTPYRKIISHMNDTIESYSNTYVMVSGGVDSMFLLNLMIEQKFKFEVIHFQHHIRDNDNLEVELVEEICSEHGLKLHVGHGVDIPESNMEAEARKQRWGFVRNTVLPVGDNLVITAHHLDDNVEQAFMSLARGAPHDSLNMPTFTHFDDHTRYRPLLSVPKDEIINRATKKTLRWIEDETNKSTDPLRNMVRELIGKFSDRANITKAMSKSMKDVFI